MAKINAVIIRRSNEENTVALVTAECDPEMVASSNDLFGAISRAVTRWCQKGWGKELLKHNSEDVNIADVWGIGDPLLENELYKEGVHSLEIDVRTDKTSWDFDDNLYDEAHLN